MSNLSTLIEKGFTPLIILRKFQNRPFVKWSDSNNHINKVSDLKNVNGVTGFSLLTGEKSGIMVIDLDRHEGSTDGVSYFKKQIVPKLSKDDLEVINNTFTVKTPNNGLHLYFKYEEGLKNKANLFDGGIDIRTDGGIICTPYSLREGNRMYEPIDFARDILDMPQSLYDLLYDECWKNKNKTSNVHIKYKPVKHDLTNTPKVKGYINYKDLASTIKQEVSIIDVLFKYYGINVRDTGTRFSIPCPVHGGKGDNFAIYPDTNTAYCFSKCDTSYNPISLVSEYYRIDYREALITIANDFGIDLERFKIQGPKQRNKATGEVLELKYENYVSECAEAITKAIKEHKKILIDAPTGGGKTRATFEVMKSFEEDLNVMLTPNVIQNKQNAKTYNVQAFTGSDKNIYSNCISATYDKARALIEYLKGKDLNVNLFIDECHLLIDASGYRMRAIRDIEELSQIANKVVYMSATNEYTRQVLTHDIELDIKPNKAINNIAESQIILLNGKLLESSLIEKVIQCSQDPKRKTILFFNNIERLKDIRKILLTKGFKKNEVALVNSKERNEHDEKVFDDIINISEIPQETRVILTTSTLEVGTNIKNDNVTMLVYMPNAKHLDINSLIQKTARIRVSRDIKNNNKLYICMPYREKEDNEIKGFEYVKAQLRKECEDTIKCLMNCINVMYKNQHEEFKHMFLVNSLNSEKGYYNLQTNVSLGVIEISENETLTINEFKLQRRAKEFYESQFFYNVKELKEKLEEEIPANKWLDTIHFESERYKEEVKEIKEVNKENKKIKQEEIKDIFKRIQELELEELFMQKVFDETINTEIGIIEEAFNLLQDTSIISYAKKGINMSLSPYEVIDSFKENGDSKIKNNLYFKKCQFKMYNRSFPLGFNVTIECIPFKDYVMCRNMFDDTCKKQGRITHAKKLELLINLIRDKNMTNYKEYVIKGNMVYKKSKAKKNDSSTTLKPLNKEKIDKLVLPLLTTVYNVSNDKISSLKTQ